MGHFPLNAVRTVEVEEMATSSSIGASVEGETEMRPVGALQQPCHPP